MLALGTGSASLAVISRRSAPPPPISAVAADGWQATMVTPAELSFSPVSVSRAGFTAAGAATTVSETLLTTKRVRLPYPDQATLTAASVALSDYVYSTDSIAGVTNNSTVASPKPIANWIMPHRLVVGTTLEAELAAFHRNASGGKQVACVEFIASDGVNPPVSVKVAAAAVSGRTGDRNAVLSYKASLDITGLAAGLITLNAKVYPRIGGATSVADSAADGNAARGFSPRYFLKNTGAKSYAYVATTGNDSTGVVSTTASTAAATPFLTVLGALNALHTAIGGTSGVDMGEIRIGNDGGTPFVLGSASATRTQKVAALTITRDPAVARANARVSFGSSAFRPRLGGALVSPLATGALLFRDLAIVRTGLSTLQGESAAQLELIFDDCDFDNASHGATWFSNSHDWHYGTTFANLSGTSPLGATSAGEHRILRGVGLQPASVAAGVSVECFAVLGCAIRNPNFVAASTRGFSGGIVAFNTFTDPPTSNIMLNIGQDAEVSGFALVQNLTEYISATTNAVLRVSGDGATGNNTHVVIHANSHAGASEAGRWNLFYDDGTTRRTSKLQSMVGNIAVRLATKGDVFQQDGAATGNFAFKHGVGCRSNFTQFQTNSAVGQGSSFAQDYAGPDANYGTSEITRNDPLFTSHQGTTVAAGPTYTAGAGGGTYTLQASSAARAMLADPVLAHGLTGAARAASNDAAGAYAA
jgi:hypothetical protein